MCSKIKITKSTKSFLDRIERLKKSFGTAECIVIGAGAGLSTSAGFAYTGERFDKYFKDFHEKYGFHNMYSGGFYPYKTPEEYWAYWSRYVYVNRYMDPPNSLYKDLFDLVKDKDYFVITTNVDHCFQKAGFDKNRLFYTQGDYGLFQCSIPCCNETFDNEKIIIEMIEQQNDMKVPTSLLPKCPHCGKPLTINLRSDHKFVEDDGWHRAAERYDHYLKTRKGKKILFLELGVGYHTPSIIKYPFWQMTASNKQATYVCLNDGEASCPLKIQNQSICINEDIGKILKELK